MIYSINEGLLNNLIKKKSNRETGKAISKKEFENILERFKKFVRVLENNESKFINSDEVLTRFSSHENNNFEKIRADFLKGKSVYIIYHMCLKEDYTKTKNHQFDVDNIINSVSKFAKSCGFEDINTEHDGHLLLNATNSSKYPEFGIELYFDDYVDICVFCKSNPCKIVRENTNESTIFKYANLIIE